MLQGERQDVQFGPRGRIGLIVPANNSVLEPEFWSVMPPGTALYATRIIAKGDLTPDAVRKMEQQVDRAVDEIVATGVDVILYADMVTTFIMEPGWNEARTEAIAAAAGAPCVSAWTALRDALAALKIGRFALGTPYPAAIHALAPPFFTHRGFTITGDATLDIVAMRDVPKVRPERLKPFVASLKRSGADAIVLLATDLPTFAAIGELERELGLPVLTSNQVLLWRALRALGQSTTIPALGRLFQT
jgi:maleate cis-trans isomerase